MPKYTPEERARIERGIKLDERECERQLLAVTVGVGILVVLIAIGFGCGYFALPPRGSGSRSPHSREVQAARTYRDSLMAAGFSREDAVRLTEARVRRTLRPWRRARYDPFSDLSGFSEE